MTTTSIDPITGYIHVSYRVPADAEDRVRVRCTDLSAGGRRTCAVHPYVSETALGMYDPEQWRRGFADGVVDELYAAGLERRLVVNPYVYAGVPETMNLRVELSGRTRTYDGGEATAEIPVGVVIRRDFRDVLQPGAVTEDPADMGRWFFDGADSSAAEPGQRYVGRLIAPAKHVELPQLTLPLDLEGPYAVLVTLPPGSGCIELRLTGDDRYNLIRSDRLPGREVLWKVAVMDRQHVVIRQPHAAAHMYEDDYRAGIAAVRFVPLDERVAEAWRNRWDAQAGRRIVAGYNEPYSWAFNENVQTPLQHREPVAAFAEAAVDIIDIQATRGGARAMYESRVGEQLVHGTFGDPVRGAVPTTNNVGKMQQYTNMLSAQTRIAREMGMAPFGNIGATNCYVGTPLEGAFSRNHPSWRRDGRLDYDVPEVRRHMLSLYDEMLEIGVEGVSIDWCRYPNSVRSAETVTRFFRELRALADRWAARRGRPVPVLTRFPARGVVMHEYMDYRTWAREGLIDYLCPGNLQGRHMSFDLQEYLDAVNGTDVKLLPALDGLNWGLPLPGMFFRRVMECYDAGCPGVYVYQCDAPVLGSPETRRWMGLVGSEDALARWAAAERTESGSYSRGVYLNLPSFQSGRPAYHRWMRIRAWTEGFSPDAVSFYLDGSLVNRCESEPYVVGSEDTDADRPAGRGLHQLTVRVEEGGRVYDFEHTVYLEN